MRWVFFFQFLLVVVNSSQPFCKHLENISCPSWANSCHESKHFPFVQIFNQSLSIVCGKGTIDSHLMRCLDVKNVQRIQITDCYMSGIDFGIFTFRYEIEHVQIRYPSFVNERNFQSASFNNMSSLRSVEIAGVKTSDLLNLAFLNVPSLTSLKIEWYNFILFPNKPFRQLINLSELYIRHGELRVLPEDLFYNLHNLTKLDLSSNKIESIHPLVLRNLTRLEYLDLSLNRIRDLPGDVLEGLSNLRIFHIYINHGLSQIPSGFFKKLHNLTEINAHYCSIYSLEEDVFSDLINLKYVDLDLNNIERLPPNLLRNNKVLTQFLCSFNKITTLPTGIFHGLSELRELNLRSNRLENLPENVFLNLSSLQTLKLSENRLTLLHENTLLPLTRLTHLDLSNNNLTEIIGKRPFGSFKHLRNLRLNKVGLTQWPVINWTEYNLTYVDFSNNHFETVKLPIYTPNRMVIKLSNCKIRTIYMDEWKYGFEMPTYYLSNNEITCDHKLRQFVFALKSNIEVAKRIFPSIKDTNCFREAKNLLDNTSFVVIGNYCPMDCQCFVEHNHVMINCSGKGIDRIPEVLPNATIVDSSNNYIKDLSNVDCVTWNDVTQSIDRCIEIAENNLSSSVNSTCIKFVCSDGVNSGFEWKMSVAVVTSLVLVGMVIIVTNVYCRRKGNVQKVPKINQDEVGPQRQSGVEFLEHPVDNLALPHPFISAPTRRLTCVFIILLIEFGNFLLLTTYNYHKFRPDFFKKLHNLTEINAAFCSIYSLGEDAFSDLINLKIVYLFFNQIEHLPPNLLRNNKLLEEFSCSFNKISTLPTGIFDGLSELRELHLGENRLENLPVNIFQNLSSLQNLDLSGNRLTFLHESIFLPLTRLTNLGLSNNSLSGFTGKRPFGSSKYLNHLNLNNAGLTQWPVINWTEYNLTYVDFSNNYFETVILPIYTPNRMIIKLSNCKIRTIYMDEWKYGFQMPTYYLNNNEITCDYKLQQFVFALKSNIKVAKEMFPYIENTKCYREKRNLLDNTSFVVIGNYCPMNCACFVEQNHVMVNCSGKGIDRIPEVLVPNATIVDLSNNYIKGLSDVDCLTWKNVTHLRLSNNSIPIIPDYFLLSNLKNLWLDGNRLTQLPSGLMNLIDVSTEFKLYLSRNNWNCHCHSLFTKDWLLRNRQKIADFAHVFCKRNSSSVSFTEIVSNNECPQITENNLASSFNDSSSNEY
ncbi:toll-like receptor Tollo [Centruroides vittatus]|uniref:toll-like receptor Tollo n=1 Tax=Centruroides vittatus TaxID=120091 RepID=UPI00350F9866